MIARLKRHISRGTFRQRSRLLQRQDFGMRPPTRLCPSAPNDARTTMTHPTSGLGKTSPVAICASSSARNMCFESVVEYSVVRFV